VSPGDTFLYRKK